MRDFGVEHTKRMHVIVARRDLPTFQHLHPGQAGAGSGGGCGAFADAEAPTAQASSWRPTISFMISFDPA